MVMRHNNYRLYEMNDEALQRSAPSAFAQSPATTVSNIYRQITTSSVINILRESGWYPVFAAEKRVLKENRLGFQKHMVVFKKREGAGWMQINESLIPEIILTNSHDGCNAYQMQAGLFRLICSNGLIVADSTFETARIRHVGFNPEMVVNATSRVLDSVPVIAGKVEAFSKVELSPSEQRALGLSALVAKHDPTPEEAANLNPDAVLRPRRSEDRKNDLWTTLNVIQENVLKGRTREVIGKHRAKEVRSIDKNISLNKALWTLAEKMNEIKSAQAAGLVA